jgi:hypothetical protein
MHMTAVDPTCTDTSVRAFGTFTQDLHDLADWFKAYGVLLAYRDVTQSASKDVS